KRKGGGWGRRGRRGGPGHFKKKNNQTGRDPTAPQQPRKGEGSEHAGASQLRPGGRLRGTRAAAAKDLRPAGGPDAAIRCGDGRRLGGGDVGGGRGGRGVGRSARGDVGRLIRRVGPIGRG